MNAVAGSSQPFPVVEGIAIFIGIVAWDVLSVGEVALVKASIIAFGCAYALPSAASVNTAANVCFIDCLPTEFERRDRKRKK
jgi:hypothetical protein